MFYQFRIFFTFSFPFILHCSLSYYYLGDGCHGIITLEGVLWYYYFGGVVMVCYNQARFRHFTKKEVFTCLQINLVSQLLVLCSSGHMHTIFINYLYSNTWIIHSVSAVRIQLSHQCSRMDITSHLCSLILTGKFMWPSTLL